MDDSLSTILYIIIAIAYFLFSILRKGKPKNKPKNFPTPTGSGDFEEYVPEERRQQKRPSFEDLLKEFTQEPTASKEEKEEEVIELPDVEIQASKPASITTAPSPYAKYQQVDYETPKTESQTPFYKSNKRMVKIEKTQDVKRSNQRASEIAELLRNPDGLKKAVILSEILKTKYF